MATTPTNREKLQALMSAMEADQNEAVDTLLELIDGDTITDFLSAIAKLREKTIPGQYADLNIGYIETVFSGVRSAILANRRNTYVGPPNAVVPST